MCRNDSDLSSVATYYYRFIYYTMFAQLNSLVAFSTVLFCLASCAPHCGDSHTQHSKCLPFSGNFSISAYQLYPENGDFDFNACVLYTGYVYKVALDHHRAYLYTLISTQETSGTPQLGSIILTPTRSKLLSSKASPTIRNSILEAYK